MPWSSAQQPLQSIAMLTLQLTSAQTGSIWVYEPPAAPAPPAPSPRPLPCVHPHPPRPQSPCPSLLTMMQYTIHLYKVNHFPSAFCRCVDENEDTVNNSECAGQMIPASSMACNTAPCVGYTWQVRSACYHQPGIDFKHNACLEEQCDMLI